MSETEFRKLDHIRICIEKDVQTHNNWTGFKDVSFIHNALPEISLEKVDTSLKFLGRRLEAPIIIEAITGGTRESTKINIPLAEAAEDLGLAMGVGSQRIAIDNPKQASTFQIVRRKAPNTCIIGNIGASQLADGYDVKEVQKAIDMINADVLAIHLNALQEAIQPEGTPFYNGVLKKIEKITSALSIPVIVKETGAGIASTEAAMLEKIGVKGIDVSGAGGTSWAAVEHYRSKQLSNYVNAKLGEVFWNWGIPTAVSIVEVCKSTKLTVIASGGIRTGIDAAKAISLGANASGLALPLLKPALEGTIKNVLEMLIKELKIAMFLIGAKSLETLHSVPLIITGQTAEWLRARGFPPEEYAKKAIN